MKPDELDQRRREVQVLDVRFPNEWDAGHIDGALHVPQDELDERIGELDRDRPVVAVCRSGSRSAEAAELLSAEGLAAENLEGGLVAWASAGLPLITAEGEPGRVADPEPPPDDRPAEHQRLQGEFLSVLFAVQEHFGDREPSDAEVRSFLHDRLVSEGKSPEEADEFLARMDREGG